jgi:hypothetical protein
MTIQHGQRFHQTSAIGVTSSQISVHIGTQKMNDDMFARLVAEDVKNRVSDTQSEYIHLPQNRERWKRALLALVRNLDEQIADIKDDKELDSQRYADLGSDGTVLLAEAMQSYDGRLAKIERFRFFVNKRLDYVVSLGEDEGAISRANFLESAILKHKSLMDEFDMEPTDIDVALWASLENKWQFDDVISPE